MKDNTAGDRNDTYGTFDRSYTYTASGSRDGQGYTNPDGSHGFVYNSKNTPDPGRRGRGAIIALAAVLTTLVLGGGCLLGALIAVRSLDTGDGGTPDQSAVPHEQETSEGLFISDDTDGQDGADTEGLLFPGNSPKPTPDETRAPGGDPGRDEYGTVPPLASIEKTPPKRQDTNGDGRPEVETDVNGEVLTSAGSRPLSVATVVNKVASSVVEITTETIVQSGYIGQYVTSGAGSGVVISKEGFVVTNHHVIDGANTITVRMSDGTEFPATLIGTDEQTDIAVLWIDRGSYPLNVATLGSSFDLVVGEDIIAIGNPLGSLGGTVTEGMVSATAREINVNGVNMTLLQVSAPINPGNSGGGLFNLAGELIGVVNAKMSDEEIEGLGFAIPIDTAYEIILELIDHGYVRGRPALGFTVVDVTSVQTAMHYFDSFYTGVYVYDNSHSEVRYGDLILAADGVEITSSSQLHSLIQGKRVGDSLELTVYRKKQQIVVTVTVTESVPKEPDAAA